MENCEIKHITQCVGKPEEQSLRESIIQCVGKPEEQSVRESLRNRV